VLSMYVMFSVKPAFDGTYIEVLLYVLHSQSTVDNVTFCMIYLTFFVNGEVLILGASDTTYILSNRREMLVLDQPKLRVV